jgi:molecular chaperone HtpG
MCAKKVTPKPVPFRAEIGQLLQILAHSLYTDREIFLRELISNASDALSRVQYLMLSEADILDPSAELAIQVFADPAAGTLIVRDTGIGMTRDELVTNLGTIAHSGARAFLDALSEGQAAADIIGQFGVGFYSVFMVAEEVRVTSRSADAEETAWTWICRGQDSYELVPAEREERGTTVWLKLKTDAAEYADPQRVAAIIQRHSDFVAYPIQLDGRVINRQAALWRRSPADVADDVADAFYRELTHDTEPPFTRVHLHTDVPVQLYALLFIPVNLRDRMLRPNADFGLQLYVRKVLIEAHNKDLLPHFLRFVEGVVDTEDLPLNLSRESVQATAVLQRIRAVLTRKVLDTLSSLSTKEPERYAEFWQAYGPFLKEGVITDAAAREKLLGLLRFASSNAAEMDGTGLTSLADYCQRLPEGQSDIYFVVAPDLASAATSPHGEAFRARGVELLYLVDPLDAMLAPAVGEFEGHLLRNVDDPSLALPELGTPVTEAEPAVPDEELAALEERVRTVLAERITDVRATDRLVDSPLRLVAASGAADADLDRVRRLMDPDWQLSPRVVELNPQHAIVRDLARLVAAGEREGMVAAAIEQLYDNALLQEGLQPNPAQMVGRVQALIGAAVAAT